MPQRILKHPASSSATVLPPVSPPPNPKCSTGSIDRPDPLPPLDGRDWGEADLAPSVSPPVPLALPSYPAAPDPATSPASSVIHSSLENCYASSRSISLSTVIAP